MTTQKRPDPGIVTKVQSTMKYETELCKEVADAARKEFGSYAEFLRIVHELYRDGKLKVARTKAEPVVLTDRDSGDEA